MLDSIEPLGADVFVELSTSQADLATVLLPRLVRVMAERSRPFLFVLDDVHLVRNPAALGILRVLIANVPSGSQLVLAGRDEPELALPREALQGRLVRLDADDLAMTTAEGVALLVAAGVQITLSAAKHLVDTTEGWAAGLYLASLVLREDPSPEDGAERFSGADRLMVDYLRDEVLNAAAGRRRIPDEHFGAGPAVGPEL